MQKSILFITTLNLATNPRLFKEIKLALENGYKVAVLCFEFENWSYEFNQQLKKDISEAILMIIPAGRKPFWPWALSVFQERSFRLLSKLIQLEEKMLSQAVSRRSNLLLKEIKKLDGPYDLVIGHNPGALYATWHAGRKFNCKTGFDIEDYHPGETNKEARAEELRSIMKGVLPSMSYLTCASDSIFNQTRSIVEVKGEIIKNYFPKDEFKNPENKTGPFKMIWFSQNISVNRGLEILIPVVEKLDDVELHLFGNCYEPFKSTFLRNLKNVFLQPPLPQRELHLRLSKFDAGLAIEPGKDLNNHLAISNKILAYFQAGLYIIASDTIGQKDFLKNYPNAGTVVDLRSDLQGSLQRLISKKAEIRNSADDRFAGTASFNWDTESQKLLKLWKVVI